MSAAKPLRLVSWNVNGVRAVADRPDLGHGRAWREELLSWDADVICLQETKAQREQLSEDITALPGYESDWHAGVKKGYSGVACYSRVKPISVTHGLGLPAFDDEGRCLILEFTDFFLFNCYFPNAQDQIKRIDYRLAFGDALLEAMHTRYAHKARVICGDFNVAHQPIDLARPRENEGMPGYSEPERRWFDKLLQAGYMDSFRHFDQRPQQYSWWSYRAGARPRNIGWRIDYFCTSVDCLGRLRGAGIRQDVTGSDHCPVTLEIDSQAQR